VSGLAGAGVVLLVAVGADHERDVEHALARGDGLADVEERVAATVRVVQRYSAETEHLGRTIIRLARPPENDGAGLPPRGYRRVGWIERALDPARERIAPGREPERAQPGRIARRSHVRSWPGTMRSNMPGRIARAAVNRSPDAAPR
jgi:hypothetical protein